MSLQERINEARARAGGYVSDNRVQISNKLDTAQRVADEQSKGRYTDKIAGARSKAEQFLRKLEEPPS